MIGPISDFASVYCSMDNYSLNSEDGFYRVNSLYLDSPDWVFLKMRLEDMDNRINMRVRSYGDYPDVPYFLEIKQKIGGVVRKYRAEVTDRNWFRAYTEPGFYPSLAGNNEKQEANRKLFERMIFTYNASPVILTQYARKAFISDVDDYARITFDRELKFRPETEYRPIPYEGSMVSSDHTLAFDPGCNVILELKCYTTRVPMWMLDMIRCFDLQRRSFSKYQTGVTEMMKFYHHDSAFRVPAFM